MKPIVIIPNKEGNIEYSKDELEKLIEDIYNEGVSDGQKFMNVPITYPNYSNPYNLPCPNPDFYKVTCQTAETNANDAISFAEAKSAKL